MNLRTFYEHETDHQIMFKKDRRDVRSWSYDLEVISEELRILAAIEQRLLKNPAIASQLQQLKRDNMLKMSALNRYEHDMRNALECDSIACDSFYLNNFEKHRQACREHLLNYREVRRALLLKLTGNRYQHQRTS